MDERRERGARAACPFSFLRRDERARFFLVSPTLSPPCTARAPLGSPPQSQLCGVRTNLYRAAPGREGRQGLDAIGAARPLLQLSLSFPRAVAGTLHRPDPPFFSPPSPLFFPVQARDRLTGEVITLKRLRSPGPPGAGGGVPAAAIREVSLLGRLKHPNIVQ